MHVISKVEGVEEFRKMNRLIKGIVKEKVKDQI